jgi:hypothetical protein
MMWYIDRMAPKFELTDKQQDLIEKGLRSAWVMGLGGVLLLVAFVLLMAKLTPTPLGQ